MPGWYYEKKDIRNSPSAQDGLDFDTEMRYRKEGARFIIDTGSKMDLGYNTTATGVVYFHRFYMFHSFRQFPRYVTACCCLFLAGKVEETPKKCKDIIKTARGLLSDDKFATFGGNPKEEVMTLERILLQTIKFDLQVEHPYSYLIKYAKSLKGDKVKLQKMVQMAWTFVNDSLCTTLALQWEPEIIAVALMYLAGKLSKFEVLDWSGRTPRHLRWWDVFVEDVTMDLLEDICHQVLDLYSSQPSSVPDSPPPKNQVNVTPIKKPNDQEKTEMNDSGSSKIQMTDIAPYQYQTFTTAPPPTYPSVYPTPPMQVTPHLTAPPPHIAAPPPHIAAPPPTVFPQYVNHPPPFPPVVAGAAPPFYPPAPAHPNSRPFYQPPPK
ncbi:cyclin-K [Harmonia axyridis]|uniref:cyclin-K n=1 Tax=Harmonia axyridis TaxID=115357 RepID=UPI001E275F16|nr:cyclin-K [Harmonia axyridis]